MQKLILTLDDLDLQSFETTLTGGTGSGTVLGHLDDASADAFACSTGCATQVYTCAGCETYDDACAGGDGPDEQRRIIVYQTTS